jgi:hypothetical protein
MVIWEAIEALQSLQRVTVHSDPIRSRTASDLVRKLETFRVICQGEK